MKKAIFIDLDGTLLSLDQNKFVKEYFSLLASKTVGKNFDGTKFMKSLMIGTEAMIKNDGKETNETVFYQTMNEVYGPFEKEKDFIMNFYEKDFSELKKYTKTNTLANEFVKWCRKNFDYVVLATNPVFPRIATKMRVEWAGLDPHDFDLITTYENSYYCKPNPFYFLELLNKFRLTADQVIMVGNDDIEDYQCASKAKIDCVIVDDYRLINEKVNVEKHCSFENLISMIEDCLKN